LLFTIMAVIVTVLRASATLIVGKALMFLICPRSALAIGTTRAAARIVKRDKLFIV